MKTKTNETWETAWELRASAPDAWRSAIAAFERAHAALLSPDGARARTWLHSLGLDGLDARRWGLGFSPDPRQIMPGLEIDALAPTGYVVVPMVDVDGDDEPCLAATPVGGDPCSAILPARTYTPILDNGLLAGGVDAVCVAMTPLEAAALSRAMGEPAVAIVGEGNAYSLALIIKSQFEEERPRRVDVALGPSPGRAHVAEALADMLALIDARRALLPGFPGGAQSVFEWLAAARRDAGCP